MPPRRRTANSLDEHRTHGEERFKRYTKSVRDMVFDAQGQAEVGNWSEAANKLNAALSVVASAAEVCRELNLIYRLTEERD
jgi:hypothetical protein